MNATSQQGYRHSWEGEVLVARVRECLVSEACWKEDPEWVQMREAVLLGR